MTQQKQSETRAELQALFQKMLEELQAWREAHPQATLDEIANEVTPRRWALMRVFFGE